MQTWNSAGEWVCVVGTKTHVSFEDGFGMNIQWVHTAAVLPTANPSPASLGVATCHRLTVVISISHVWNLLRTEDVHLQTPALRIGTNFLLTLETVVFLFHLLSTTSKPFSSLSIRLAHAARLGFFYKKTRYINSLLLTMNVNTYTTQQNHVRSRITRGGARIYEIRSPNSV